ncbi:response regulator [Flavihumibacter sp. CACIAM 22H1]|uniref:response regulator n=1 Tax=Flavihumibacter sp. CACIAM 22H1 TaxID=1812911 RepID=UPI0007A84E98|nr:response regulator [Flavihumibacter sp. CACIAM 22H1]KYP16300.1 MAG: DNA-binding response regulator [Flavihumibacter sp. CACIAM 22H1]
MNKTQILIIEDEPALRTMLEITLQANNYAVQLAKKGKDGLIMAENHPPDLILLDLGLPDIRGQELLVQLRTWFTNPIIIISVQKEEEEIIKALDNGANDYLSKPFRTGELLARMRASLRSVVAEDYQPVLQFSGLSINLEERTVRREEELIRLTTTEYNLLLLLAKNEGKVLTHAFLLRTIWGPGFINQSQYLRVFIAQLRKKLEPDPNNPSYIITESGVGYRFLGMFG